MIPVMYRVISVTYMCDDIFAGRTFPPLPPTSTIPCARKVYKLVNQTSYDGGAQVAHDAPVTVSAGY